MTVESRADLLQPEAAKTLAKSASVPRYALGLLVVVYVFNNLDRQIINILAEPIRHELGLRDWQLGMLTGLSFALFYATLGIPIARLAERGNRARIIAISIVTWSFFTAVCGFAQNFLQLILARIGVGVGEAGCTPAAHSLISDIVPREKRASALATFSMGGPLGGLLGTAMGGLLIDLWGWRSAFFVAAAPGLLVGALVALTLKDPRAALKLTPQAAEPAPTFKEALRELKSSRTFWLFAIGSAFQGIVAYGHSAFLGSFFFRNHGPGLAETAAFFGLKTASFLGLALGLIAGVAGVLGTIIGGKLADRHVAKNQRGVATQVAVCNFLATPIYIVAMLVDSTNLALVTLAVPALILGMTYGPIFSVFQGVVQPRTRATAVSIYLLLTNLIGLGLGPLLAGILSDHLAVGLGAAEGLRWAQIGATLLGFVAAGLFWASRKHIVRDTVS